ncbi:Unknown protein [Striga hermonthica]|uniref:Retrotransposon gag domain-containing protein n=1 Tax=Striga hermonthica TaxID=68872 RepID=A0A9N7N6I6_STRHE|nr:Unknown protein [Striga hermonthica]
MFQYSRVSEEEKVLCASFMLRGSAGHWWDTIKCIEDVTTVTWDRFKELFRNNYLTAPTRAMKMNKFIQLRQGSMTVADYIHKFEQLSRFGEHMVSTDALKMERFLEGLKPELYRDVYMAGVHGSTYSQVAERALVAEQAELKIRNAVEDRRQLVQKQGPRWVGMEKKRPMQFQTERPIFQQRQRQEQGDANKRIKFIQGKAPALPPTCPN